MKNRIRITTYSNINFFTYVLAIIFILIILFSGINISTGAPDDKGPDCIGCHEIDNEGSPQVDCAMIVSSVHSLLNFDCAVSPEVNENNRICWGCHQSNGTQPDGHPDKAIDPYSCIECHARDTDIQPLHVAPGVTYPAPGTGQEIEEGFLRGTPATGKNMTHKKDTITGVGYANDPPEFNVRYARHANPNSIGGWIDAQGPSRDRDQVCINCHAQRVRYWGLKKESYWNGVSSCIPCHQLWIHDQYNPNSLYPSAHTLSIPSCTDCHAQSTGLNNPYWHASSSYNWLDSPKDYTNELTATGMMLNDSVHRRMVLNTTTGHTTDYTGCIVCHTEVTFIFNSSTGPIDMQITDHSGAHTWNSKPDCTKCHSINTNIERPGPYPGGHESFNMEWENNTQCLGCHVGKQSHGHSVSGGGDPDCISCHDIDSSALSRVNVSFINSSAHMNLNIDAIDTSGNPDNKICWGCHQPAGTAPPKGVHDNSDPYQCVDCHSNQLPPSHIDAPDVEAEFLSGDAPVGSNMTFNRDTIIFSGFYGNETGNREVYSKHANLDPGGYPGLTGLQRDSNKVCYNCHNSLIRKYGEYRKNNWEIQTSMNYELMTSGSCENLCHQNQLAEADPHMVETTRCTDCHTIYAETNNPGIRHNEWLFNYDDLPGNYGRVPNIGDMLNQSAHRRMVEDLSDHPSDDKGCLICHSMVDAEVSYDASQLTITILDDTGTHGWNSEPSCIGCHPINGLGTGPIPDPDNHSGIIILDNNSECLGCHSNSEGHGHAVGKGTYQNWNKWIDPLSDGGIEVTTTELQEAIHHWLENITVNGHLLSTQDLQGIIAKWLL